MEIYDLIILGAGPAGITASIYSARKQLKHLVLSEDIGGQASWSSDIENYIGFQFITGADLTSKFSDHMKKYDIPVKEGTRIETIRKKDDVFEIVSDSDSYISKSILVATGKKSKKLNVPGEDEFRNKGVAYCATCDGPLFSGKDVLVVGGGNSAIDAILQLIGIANKVYVVNNKEEFIGDEYDLGKLKHVKNLEIMHSSLVLEIIGDKLVNKVRIKADGQEKTIDVNGVFIEIGLIPNSEFAEELEKNHMGEILVDKFNKTNIPGIFAAGDVTDVPEKQIIIAAGEGAKAALGAFKYLASRS